MYGCLTEYDEKKHMEAVRAEGKEEGLEEGKVEGKAEKTEVDIAQVESFVDQGLIPREVADLLIEEIRSN